MAYWKLLLCHKSPQLTVGNWEKSWLPALQNHAQFLVFPCTAQHTCQRMSAVILILLFTQMHLRDVTSLSATVNHLSSNIQWGGAVGECPQNCVCKGPELVLMVPFMPLENPRSILQLWTVQGGWVFRCAPCVIKKDNPEANSELYSLWALCINPPTSPCPLQGI